MLQLEHGGYFGKPMAVEMISELASTLGISLDMDGYTKLCQSTKVGTKCFVRKCIHCVVFV